MRVSALWLDPAPHGSGVVLTFADPYGQGVEVELSPALLHVLVTLLQEARRGADKTGDAPRLGRVTGTPRKE